MLDERGTLWLGLESTLDEKSYVCWIIAYTSTPSGLSLPNTRRWPSAAVMLGQHYNITTTLQQRCNNISCWVGAYTSKDEMLHQC